MNKPFLDFKNINNYLDAKGVKSIINPILVIIFLTSIICFFDKKDKQDCKLDKQNVINQNYFLIIR